LKVNVLNRAGVVVLYLRRRARLPNAYARTKRLFAVSLSLVYVLVRASRHAAGSFPVSRRWRGGNAPGSLSEAAEMWYV